ncbi:MAG: hypothetical protein RL172_2513 [Bacteroidota bacterium]|jgi:hypothetical protein
MKKLLNGLGNQSVRLGSSVLSVADNKDCTAVEACLSVKKEFTAADLWNIHKNGRSRNNRRFL